MSTPATQFTPYLPIYILPILLTLLVFQIRLKKIWTILLLIPVGGIAFLTSPLPFLPLMFAYGHYFMAPYAWLMIIRLLNLIISNLLSQKRG